jgi:hypothetical protein
MIASREIITISAQYYSVRRVSVFWALLKFSLQVWRCDEVLAVLNNATALNQTWPQCSAGLSTTFVTVLANAHDKGLGLGSAIRVVQGMALWIAMVMHGVGIEIYVRISKTLCR